MKTIGKRVENFFKKRSIDYENLSPEEAHELYLKTKSLEEFEAKQKKRKNSFVKKLILKFLKKEKVIWQRDVPVAKKIFEKYPKEDFWEMYEPPSQEDIFSFNFFLLDYVQRDIDYKYKFFNNKIDFNKEVFNLDEKNYSTFTQTKLKPKTIKDFFR